MFLSRLSPLLGGTSRYRCFDLCVRSYFLLHVFAFRFHRGDLAAEQSRRAKLEAIILRGQGGGGIRPGAFPSVRDVNRNVENLAGDALTWTEKAAAIGGSSPALPATIQSVLENTFAVCSEEVKRCLDGRLKSLSEFLGHGEPVALSDLSGGDSMNLDTQYVLYECLCRNFETIVPTGPESTDKLAGEIERRCGGTVDRGLASDIISDDAWPSFENLMKNYIAVFVEVRFIGLSLLLKLVPGQQ